MPRELIIYIQRNLREKLLGEEWWVLLFLILLYFLLIICRNVSNANKNNIYT